MEESPLTTIDEFASALESADPGQWEEIYGSTPVAASGQEMAEIVRASRPCSDWLAFRLDAGLPGTPLPPLDSALEKVLTTREGDPLDAYRVIFAGKPVPVDADPHLILALLINSAASALKGGLTWMATWLVARAGLAAIALGEPARAWAFLDDLVKGKRRHPHLDKLVLFEGIRDIPELEQSQWVRGAIWHIWPHLEVPAVPMLPLPEPGPFPDQSPVDAITLLRDHGCLEIAELVDAAVRSMNNTAADHHGDDLLVRKLVQLTLSESRPEPPEVPSLPEWFEDWAKAQRRAGRLPLARLAGLLLHEHKSGGKTLAAVCVWPLARRSDLPLLKQGFKQVEVQGLLDELSNATEDLPLEVADALVSFALNNEGGPARSLQILADHLSLLQEIPFQQGGMLQSLVGKLVEIIEDRRREQEAVQPQHQVFIEQVKLRVARLGDPRMVNSADVERAAAEIEVPALGPGFFEVCGKVELTDLEQLVQALALRRTLQGTPLERELGPVVANEASRAIGRLELLPLCDLRLRLLDELLQKPHPDLSAPRLYFQRANTRRALHFIDAGARKEVMLDLERAMAGAEQNADRNTLAEATAAWGRVMSEELALGGPKAGIELRSRALERMDSALELPLPDELQTPLIQARAHLRRPVDARGAAEDFRAAVDLSTMSDPLRLELAAELVSTLTLAGDPDEAVSLGLSFLNDVTEEAGDTSIGMLHAAMGQALMRSGGPQPEARRHLEAAVDRFRGRDPHNDATTRLQLLGLGLALGDMELVEQQRQVLRDRWESLDGIQQADLTRLEVAANRSPGENEAARTALVRGIAAARGTPREAQLRLEQAQLDLREGRKIPDLDRLIEKTLDSGLDDGQRAMVFEISCNHGEGLSAATLRRVADLAEEQAYPSVQARLLVRLGDTDSAVEILRQALGEPLTAGERLACTHQLVVLLPEAAAEESLLLCKDLEEQLDTGEDVPSIRIDLAEALRRLAQGSRDLLERAWQHGQRALPGLNRPAFVEQGHRVLALVLDGLLRARMPESSPEQAALAHWLLGPHPLKPELLGNVRLSLAHILLLGGPFSHPAAVATAGELIALAEQDIGPDPKVLDLADRQKWVASEVEGTRASIVRGTNVVQGSLDDAPTWVVDLIAGRDPEIPIENIQNALPTLSQGLGLRPDMADHALSRLLPLMDGIAPGIWQDLLRLVQHQVMDTGRRRPEDWPRTRAALEAIPVASRGSALRSFERALGCKQGPKRSTARPQKRYSGSRQRAEASFREAVAIMDQIRPDPYQVDAKEMIEEARQLLAEVVRIGQKKKMPQLFVFLVSLGNAWRMEPDEDLEKALKIYARSSRMKADRDQHAKLWKVTADALIKRGGDDDLREAEELLKKALEVRQGWLRVETLWSASYVAQRHPDLDEEQRVIQAAEHLMAAVREDAPAAEKFLPPLLNHLARWQERRLDDPRVDKRKDELRKRYPHRCSEIDRGGHIIPKDTVKDLVHLFRHPAARFALREVARLKPLSEVEAQSLGLLEGRGPSEAARTREFMKTDSLHSRPEAIEARLSELEAEEHAPEERPGAAVARVHLAAALARCGRREASLASSLSRAARASIAEVKDRRARAFLLHTLAEVWIPRDWADDPVKDFGLGLEMMREALELEGGESRASVDTLGYLARALRYSPAGDIAENLEESRRLYGAYLERLKKQRAHPDLIANALFCLAEVESQMAKGDRLARLQAGEQMMSEAVALAQSQELRAELTFGLAWQRTQIGLVQEGRPGVETLRQALSTFDEVSQDDLPEDRQGSYRLNRAVCASALARREDGRQAEMSIWREELERCDPRRHPTNHATMQHNLASALLSGAGIAQDELREGIQLCEEAVRIRTAAVNPRHYWETALLAGGALTRVLLDPRIPADELPWRPHEVWHEARRWLRQAVEAVRQLGPGKELLDTAFNLVGLCPTAGSLALATEVAEEAWAVLGEASPYLLLNAGAREEEAKKALAVCRELAHRLAEDGLSIESADLAFIMEGERAETVLRWTTRSQAPLRRPLRARIQRPPGVPIPVWMEWQDALRRGDPVDLVEPLARVREMAPGFLSETPDLSATWSWLAAHPEAMGISVTLAQPVTIALVLQCDASGHRRIRVIGLETSAPPSDLEDLTTHLCRTDGGAGEAGMHHDAAASWVRSSLVDPILDYLGERPSIVLWSPGPGLRLLSPRSIWGEVPVVSTLSLDLPILTSAPARPRSTLVVLADPKEGEPPPGERRKRDPLGEHGSAALEALTAASARRGPVRRMASVGKRHGRDLLGSSLDVCAGPASARHLTSEAAEHDLLVVIAHGEVPRPEQAALICVNEAGEEDRLDLGAIARAPERFTGALVILISCDAGRVGDSLTEPGGLAGALIAAGARAVVAPLWPVRLDVAAAVIKGVLEAIATGKEPWEALAGSGAHIRGGGPILGPAPSLSHQKAADAFQRLAFVTWVG